MIEMGTEMLTHPYSRFLMIKYILVENASALRHIPLW